MVVVVALPVTLPGVTFTALIEAEYCPAVGVFVLNANAVAPSNTLNVVPPPLNEVTSPFESAGNV